MDLEVEDDCEGNGWYLIRKASIILWDAGLRKESDNIKQEASVNGFEFYKCLQLLKRYMDI